MTTCQRFFFRSTFVFSQIFLSIMARAWHTDIYKWSSFWKDRTLLWSWQFLLTTVSSDGFRWLLWICCSFPIAPLTAQTSVATHKREENANHITRGSQETTNENQIKEQMRMWDEHHHLSQARSGFRMIIQNIPHISSSSFLCCSS